MLIVVQGLDYDFLALPGQARNLALADERAQWRSLTSWAPASVNAGWRSVGAGGPGQRQVGCRAQFKRRLVHPPIAVKLLRLHPPIQGVPPDLRIGLATVANL